ncbi:hypothetical protein NQZ68_032287 [Dissostichus eleginoides]|nr:hypothetical protein NQZ68_032287 [Dissostichus eleginoides]
MFPHPPISLEESCGRCRKANEHVHIPAILLSSWLLEKQPFCTELRFLWSHSPLPLIDMIYSVPTEQDQKGTV